LEDASSLRAALRLEITTIVWMIIEAAVAIGAGIAANSLLLVAFGIDSGIELASAIVVFQRSLNAVTHWWWIDSVGSLAIVPLLLREGYEAISDRGCSACS
jgi:divalent metal cation (Fe/Co/Zn/Cd) transporter